MGRKRANPRIGSDFEDFLREEGRLEDATTVAVKRVFAWRCGCPPRWSRR